MPRNNSYTKLVDNDGNVLDIQKELERLNKKMDGKIGVGSAWALAAFTITLIVGLLTFTNKLLVDKDINFINNQLIQQQEQLTQQLIQQQEQLKEQNKELRELRDRLIMLERNK